MKASPQAADVDVTQAWARRYLAVLGINHDRPSLSALSAITRAHLQAVTFENVTALRRRAARPEGDVPALDPEALLAAWEERRGGGVCFEIADMVGRLLIGLGYRATFIQGQISFPGSHQAVMVDLDGNRFLVDVGCGAPFFAPIPLAGVTEVRHAGLAYRFRPGEGDDQWLQERWIHGDWAPHCRYELRPVDDAAREAAYQRHHLPGESWVTGGPRLVACGADHIASLSGDELTIYAGDGKQTRRIDDPADYVQLAADVFRLPALPIVEALAIRSESAQSNAMTRAAGPHHGMLATMERDVMTDSLNVGLLQQLCATPGIAGREDQVRAVVAGQLRPLVDDLRIDALGNVVGTRHGDGPRVMIAAHMDEIGFFVTHIDDHGFLRLQPVGGFDARTLVAQRVLVRGFAGATLPGTVQPAAKPIHLLEKSEIKPAKLEELFVDVGLPVDRVRAQVEVGDMVTVDRELIEAGDRVMGKALDDRVGVFVMIEALRAMGPTNAEIVAVATTQEEVGLRGAGPASFDVQPDVAIALDVTLALDIPGMASELAVTHLGDGVAIKVMDSSHIANPALLRHLRDLAETHQIPYQLEILPRGGTDAAAMQRARGGAPAITLSIPTRYVHTANEMADRGDIAATISLLARYLEDAGSRSYGYGE